MKAERFEENCLPESHHIFTCAHTDTCPVPQKPLTRLHFSGRIDCLINEMSWSNTALALRGLFPNYLRRLSTRTETINNKEHFGKLEIASWALGNFPVQSTDTELWEFHLLEVVPPNKWVIKAVSKGKFVLCVFTDHCGNARCNGILSSLHGIEYKMPQAGHEEQVSKEACEMLFAKHYWAIGLQWQFMAEDTWRKIQMAPILEEMFAYCIP